MAGAFTFKYCCGTTFAKTFRKLMASLRKKDYHIFGQEKEIAVPENTPDCKYCNSSNAYEMTVLYKK